MGRRGPKPAKHLAIAKAALALFVERGLKGATTRAIAKRARTTEASLYRHYPGKDALARHVLRTSLEGLEHAIERSQSGRLGARARLRAYVRAYAEFARDFPFEHSFLQQAYAENLFSRLGELPRTRRVLSTILAEGQAQEGFLAVEPRWLAAFLAGGLGRVSQAASRRGSVARLELPVEVMCAAVESMLASTARPPDVSGNGAVPEKIVLTREEAELLVEPGANSNGRES